MMAPALIRVPVTFSIFSTFSAVAENVQPQPIATPALPLAQATTR
ncbi:hypothetical protein [Methanosphaerula palustris]|uniref:Uncharacterized protein n=1 Tax=Methanosphaerula palustris (strain ATCC BAA-1556 / DSM 19958 / E1-9c) TaxID=521011 RepID=B8GIW0_METPE|nr:hypothetical protein [Methanosphaerula palustris]ACL16923.1 hypothetical protein Mpal_1611 [Methanosphaerula palustris E1-9c]